MKWDKYPHGPSVVEAPSKCLGFSVQPGDHYGLKCGLLGHVWSPLNSHGRVWQRGHGRRSGCRRGLAPGAGRNWLLHPPQVCGNCGWAPQGLRWDTGMKTCFLRDKRLRESSPCLPGCVCVCMCVCVCVWSSEWRVRVCVWPRDTRAGSSGRCYEGSLHYSHLRAIAGCRCQGGSQLAHFLCLAFPTPSPRGHQAPTQNQGRVRRL